MTLLQSILLGIIQGATEFIPVSSSGHLVLLPYFLGWEIPSQEAFVFNVLVQVATLIAVFAYFWEDLMGIARATVVGLWNRKPFREHNSRLGWYLVLSTIPAGIAALLFKDTFEEAFSNPKWAAFFLLGTALLLVIAEQFQNRARALEKITWLDALWTGLFQVLALFPGISRSGATITGGMTRKFTRRAAARFSFLMSVPIMLAAGLLAILDLFQAPDLLANFPIYMAGFLTAAVVGYLSIRWLLRYLSSRSLYVFAIYCALLGTTALGMIFVSSYASPPTPTAAPSPTPDAIFVAISPVVGESGRQILRTCAWGLPKIVLQTKETVALFPDPSDADLTLWWGIPNEYPALSEPDVTAVTLGAESVSLIVHQANPINALNAKQVKEIYTAHIRGWDEISESNELGEIQTLAYPATHPLRSVFDNIITPQSRLSPYALLAPSPSAVLEVVQENPAAIGYLPSSFPVTGVKKIPLQAAPGGVQQENLEQPILGVFRGELKDGLAAMTHCLQTNFPAGSSD